jgi:hypothetical protein
MIDEEIYAQARCGLLATARRDDLPKLASVPDDLQALSGQVGPRTGTVRQHADTLHPDPRRNPDRTPRVEGGEMA